MKLQKSMFSQTPAQLYSRLGSLQVAIARCSECSNLGKS